MQRVDQMRIDTHILHTGNCAYSASPASRPQASILQPLVEPHAGISVGRCLVPVLCLWCGVPVGWHTSTNQWNDTAGYRDIIADVTIGKRLRKNLVPNAILRPRRWLRERHSTGGSFFSRRLVARQQCCNGAWQRIVKQKVCSRLRFFNSGHEPNQSARPDYQFSTSLLLLRSMSAIRSDGSISTSFISFNRLLVRITMVLCVQRCGS